MNTKNGAHEKLKQYRSIIAILEIASLLHDIGKCDNRFPEGKLRDKEVAYDHLSILEEAKLTEKSGLKDLFFYNFATICKEPLNRDIIDEKKVVCNEWALRKEILNHS